MTFGEFVDREFYPAAFENPNALFEDLHFEKHGKEWWSPYHYDLSEHTGPNPRRSKIIPSRPYIVIDHSNKVQRSIDFISLYMKKNGFEKKDRIAAILEMSKKLNVSPPPLDGKAKQYFECRQERQQLLERSIIRQQEALFADEGAAALSYMKGRGWKVEEVQKAELGYMSAQEYESLFSDIIAIEVEHNIPEPERTKYQKTVGSTHVLTLCLRSGGKLYGFKFRAITDAESKYVYLSNTKKSENLFNLTGVKHDNGSVVVVEGELDALHARVKGIENMVATGGGYLNKDFLRQLKQMGVRYITLLFDNDDAGHSYIKKSIEEAAGMGMHMFVATLCDEPDGTHIKDVDDYLMRHSVDDLKELIANAESSSMWQFKQKTATVTAPLNDLQRTRLKTDAIEIANAAPSEEERDNVLEEYRRVAGAAGCKQISLETLRKDADKQRADVEADRLQKMLKRSVRDIDSLYNGGDANGTIKKIFEAADNLQHISKKSKYGKLLHITREDEIISRQLGRKPPIPTEYKFEGIRGSGVEEVLHLPSGAITLVCAYTSHGKSTFLQNLALQAAQSGGEGVVLYFAYEEDADNVVWNLLNKYMNLQLCDWGGGKTSTNYKAIEHYYTAGSTQYIKGAAVDEFYAKKKEFYSKLINNGKLRVYNEQYDSTELVEAVRAVQEEVPVKAVFIDYIQLVSSGDETRRNIQRTEQLKNICIDIKNLAIESKLPVVVASQMNRQVMSPLHLQNQKIAESADLERIANKIICLWDTSVKIQVAKDEAPEMQALQTRWNFSQGVSQKIYAKMTKNRNGRNGLEACFDYNGNTGVIMGNLTEDDMKKRDDSAPDTQLGFRGM